VKIEFDPEKDAINLDKHGISLARAIDLSDIIVVEDGRYNETRFRLYGQIDGEWYCAAVTLRDDAVRIINLRRAHDTEWTDSDFARARPVEDFPALAAAFPKARGRPVGSTKPSRKEQIALRVDADVLARYKAGGPGWQTRMNEVLRAGVAG
jgi:uncharacterized protein